MPCAKVARVGAFEPPPALSAPPSGTSGLASLFADSISGLGHAGTEWSLLLPRLPSGSPQLAGSSSGVLKVTKGQTKSRNARSRFGAVTMAQGSSMSAKEAQNTVELVQNIGAGALARTIAQACIHPLDTIKTRMQVSSNINALQTWQTSVAASCRRIRWGLINMRVCNWVGPRGLPDLYLGLAGAVAGTLPSAFVFFATDEAMKRALAKHFKKDRRDMVAHVVSSSAAAFTSALLRVPGDVLKHRVQAYVFSDMWQAAQHVWRAQGIRGLYCGFGATLLRDVPEMTIQFSVYEALRKAVTGGEESDGSENSEGGKEGGRWVAPAWASHPLLLGGIAGAAAATITTPLDVIKTQLQCQGVCSVSAAVQHLLATRGVAGLTAGMGARVLQTTILSATFFALYEAFKQRLAASRTAAADASQMGADVGFGYQGHGHQQLQLLHARDAAAIASVMRAHSQRKGWWGQAGRKPAMLLDTAQQLA